MEAEAVSTSSRNSSEEKKKSREEKARGKHWSEEATATLIDLWGKETVQLPFENSKSSKQSSQVFKSLLVSLLGQISSTRILKEEEYEEVFSNYCSNISSPFCDHSNLTLTKTVFLCFNSQSSIHIILIGPVGKGRIQGYQSKRIDQ